MLTIDVNLFNNPVLITCPTQRLPSEQREYDHLTGYVVLNNASSASEDGVSIGGVRVIWQVTVQEATITGLGQRDARDGLDAENEASQPVGLQGQSSGHGRVCGKCKSKDGRKHRGTGRWGRTVVIDRYETLAVGPMGVPRGQTRLEFGISVRPEIELSRVSHFDRIQHTLYGIVLTPPPIYPSASSPNPNPRISCIDRSGSSSCSGSLYSSEIPSYAHATNPPPEHSSRSTIPANTHYPMANIESAPTSGLLDRWKNRIFPRTAGSSVLSRKHSSSGSDWFPSQCQHASEHGILTQCARVIPVWSLDISGEYNWTHSTGVPKMAGAGVKLAISSDALVLGGALSSTVTLTDLPEDMTIHAVSLNLVQTTRAPKSKLNSASDQSANDPEGEDNEDGGRGRAFVIDEWTLAEAGTVPVSSLAGRRAPEAARADARRSRGRKGKSTRSSRQGCDTGVADAGREQAGLYEMSDLWRHGRPLADLPLGIGMIAGDAIASPLSATSGTDISITPSSIRSTQSSSVSLDFRARLPSPLLGAASSTSHPLAPHNLHCKGVTIQHAWSLVIHFSQLGTDTDGLPLTEDHYAVRTSVRAGAGTLRNVKKMEGAVRTWMWVKDVVVGSDVAMGKEVVAPVYDYNDDAEHGPRHERGEGSERGPRKDEAEGGARSSTGGCGGEKRVMAMGLAGIRKVFRHLSSGLTSAPRVLHDPYAIARDDTPTTTWAPTTPRSSPSLQSFYDTSRHPLDPNANQYSSSTRSAHGALASASTPARTSAPSRTPHSPPEPQPLTSPSQTFPAQPSSHIPHIHLARQTHMSQWALNSSIALPHKRSHTVGDWTFLRAVERREEEMRRKVQGHWDETGGLCACFRRYGCAVENGPGGAGVRLGGAGEKGVVGDLAPRE